MNRALRAATIGCLLIAPVALSSCSAGQIPQTSTQNRDKVGAMGTIGAIDLREVKLPFPAGGTYSEGGDAELVGAVVNGGSEADTLVSVTGDDFTGIRISGSGTAPQSSTSSLSSVPGSPVGTVGTSGASSSGSSSSSSSSSGSSGSSSSSQANQTGPTTAPTGIAGATGTPSAAAPSAAQGASSLELPADTTLFLGQNSPHVFLTGLKKSLTAGQVVRMTFTFQRAGSVTLDAFVSSPVSNVPNSSSFDFEQPSEASVPGNQAGGGNG